MTALPGAPARGGLGFSRVEASHDSAGQAGMYVLPVSRTAHELDHGCSNKLSAILGPVCSNWDTGATIARAPGGHVIA